MPVYSPCQSLTSTPAFGFRVYSGTEGDFTSILFAYNRGSNPPGLGLLIDFSGAIGQPTLGSRGLGLTMRLSWVEGEACVGS